MTQSTAAATDVGEFWTDLDAGLQRLAEARGTSVLKEAISAARAVSGMDSLLILAAAVEHSEPTAESAGC